MKIVGIALSALLLTSIDCSAQTQSEGLTGKKIEAKMTCSAYSSNKEKQPAFQVSLPMNFSGGLFTAERKLTKNPGKETFYGLIGRLSNDITLIGEGRLEDGTGVWVYEFHGKFNPDKTTVLKGALKSTLGAIGGRTCSVEFG